MPHKKSHKRKNTKTYHYSDVAYFANDWAQSVNFANPDGVPESEIMPVVEQLRIFWHIVQDPVETFLDKMKLAAPDFPINDYRGKTFMLDFLRLMMVQLSEILAVHEM